MNDPGVYSGVIDVPESESEIRISISVAVIEIFTNYCPKRANYRGLAGGSTYNQLGIT